MFLLFFLITQDSLPPIPDLTRIRFPEPPLWIVPEPNVFNLGGYAGNYYGGHCYFKYDRFSIAGQYKKEYTWDSIMSSTLNASYSLPFPHVWLRPGLHAYLLHRNDEYRLLTPSLQFSSTLPWAMVRGVLHYDFWQIDRTNYTEEKARLSVIFDKMPFIPSLEVSELYSNGTTKPTLGMQFHIHNIHFNIGSAIVYGFPSPFVEIAYRQPKINIATRIKSGVVYQTLQDYFDPTLPIHYRIPVPGESLNIEAGFRFDVNLYEHIFALYGFYKDWKSRLIAGHEFELSNLHDVREATIGVMFRNRVSYNIIEANNALHVDYHWTDSMIPFLSEYTIADTLSLHVSYVELASALYYVSKRDGITEPLPSVFIINPRLAFVFRWLKIFVAIYNVTDKHAEVFDGYFLNERQYAGGLEIYYTF